MSILKQVLAYNGHNNFMNSLRNQLMFKGTLSEKQIVAAQSFFGAPQANLEAKKPTLSYKAGDEITVRKWFAQGKAKELNIRYFFRNLVVEEVLAETPKGVLVKIRFNDKVTTCCHLCGLGLDTEVSKATGIGPVCAKKLGFSRVSVADAGMVLEKIKEEAKIAGILTMWLPKSQIVSKAEQILFERE